MNVLCLGSEVVGTELASELVRAFLAARFDGGDRYPPAREDRGDGEARSPPGTRGSPTLEGAF